MFLKYGNYTHAAGECSLAVSRQGQFVGGMEKGYTERRWDVRGRLQVGDSGSVVGNQAAMTAAIAALQTAYSTQGQDWVFYTDGGADFDPRIDFPPGLRRRADRRATAFPRRARRRVFHVSQLCHRRRSDVSEHQSRPAGISRDHHVLWRRTAIRDAGNDDRLSAAAKHPAIHSVPRAAAGRSRSDCWVIRSRLAPFRPPTCTRIKRTSP